jgi:hypothetical protein
MRISIACLKQWKAGFPSIETINLMVLTQSTLFAAENLHHHGIVPVVLVAILILVNMGVSLSYIGYVILGS